MSTNIFQRIARMLPDAPVYVGKVLELHDDDTSTVELPIGLSTTAVGGGLARGSLIRPRGRTVPVGGWAFVRRGVIETRAPDPAPEAVIVGGAVTPPEEGLFFAAGFEADGARDDVGNWLHEEYAVDLTVNTGDGAPGSTGGYLEVQGYVRVFIKHVDNETGGTSPLLADAASLSSADWVYEVYCKRVGTSGMDLGGFNAGGGGSGQALFNLRYGYDVPDYFEAQIDDATGAWFLYGELPAPLSTSAWSRVRLRKTGSTFEILLGDTVVATDSSSFSGDFTSGALTNFCIARSESGTQSGRIDEISFSAP